VTIVREREAVDVVDARPGIRERLASSFARTWYIGAGVGLLWQALLIVSVIVGSQPVAAKVVGLVLLALFYGAFMVLGPIVAVESRRTRLLAIAAYWALSWILFPFVGVQTIWLWLLVASLLAFVGLTVPVAVTASVLVVAAQLLIAFLSDFALGTVFAPIVTTVCAVTFIGLGYISRSNQNLKFAHHEIARLAVIEERARFSRDLHDVLGHSLTVVAVKSDLARRLVAIDPEGAEREMADVEGLARNALADLRLAVSNYRELSLESELLAARTALDAAGIAAQLPDRVEEVEDGLGSAFAWVLREGVTNVIRHSGADSCWISLGSDHLTVEDNGRGPSATPTEVDLVNGGNGLRGLSERTAAVGAELHFGRGPRGGFELTARRAA
jgi:two-component system sensor histidine kinase DesK